MSRNLSPASKVRYRRQVSLDILHHHTDGVNLVALALENPSEVNGVRCKALLGRSHFLLDEMRMVQKLTNKRFNSFETILTYGIQPSSLTTLTIDCWKLIVIDCRHVEDSADLDRQYRAQLQAEELQTPEEPAREAVRSQLERTARRNAKLMVPALEKLSPEKYAMMLERKTLYTVWQKVSPKPPAWVFDITEYCYNWGFVFYRSAQVMQLVGDRWDDALERLEGFDELFYPENPTDQPIYATAGPSSIHNAGENFIQYWSPVWIGDTAFADGDLRNAREWARLEPYIIFSFAYNYRHFKEYRKSLDDTEGILDNTLIIIDSDCVHPELMTAEEINALPTMVFWVWACDPDWKPPAGRDADEDGYQGRLRVPFTCLQAWFYAARLKDVDMKAMWKKAQAHPQQLWVCNSLPQQEWKHEPYV
ncbi:uncharacterized protein ColSpa_06094 [Colletotrichum spaethianum]|uniref:Uncharacterized protein n=1 Tax=Colletotrichum spaethianum TaxID=700344 RepID=A0AA37LCK1_9PEZI|nr:uncharacterized protein ColSpa_06094 [Colletotrichum spaethianum]GKT45913.1 hypothetical protein ColSpa_06094 [Colletotrichum spaethianum]